MATVVGERIAGTRSPPADRWLLVNSTRSWTDRWIGRMISDDEAYEHLSSDQDAPSPATLAAPEDEGSEGSPTIEPEPLPGETSEPPIRPEPVPGAGVVTGTAPQAAISALIAEDEAETLAPGQMRKTPFLAELRAAACAEADRELARAGRSTEGCPFLERALSRYAQRSAARLERAIRLYAPETRGVTSAGDYIPAVSARVAQGVARWTETGEVSGVPEDLLGGGLAGVPSGLAAGISSALTAVGAGLRGLFSGVGPLLAKVEPGVAPPVMADPLAVGASLGRGARLDPSVRPRFEAAFGHDFSQVKVHADGASARLARDLGARAFTVGSHVAFAEGQYRPGTPVGDAVLAHELAHVVQQGGSAGDRSASAHREEAVGTLEDEADRSAFGAVVSLWGGGTRAPARPPRLSRTALPGLRSGLRLQRCAAAQQQVRAGEPDGCTKEQRESLELPPPSCCTPSMRREIDASRGQGTARVRNAIRRLSSPSDAESLLRSHFNIGAGDTARVRYVRDHFERMLATITSEGAVSFYCRDSGDYVCRQFNRRAAADNCSSTRPVHMWFCGNYHGERFFSDGDWTRSLVHEYAHAACDTVGGINAAGRESYRNLTPYPPADPDQAIRNADSYAWFASES